ncbi:MAG: septum formation family protein [Chloroflexota bacterium]
MPEIDRYRRASLREQLGDVVGWFRSHPVAAIAVLVLGAGYVAQFVSPQRPTRPTDLFVGECLFARTGAVNDTQAGARPIGGPSDVGPLVLAGAAEYAPCSSSHGHEVLAVIPLTTPAGAYENQLAAVQVACEAGFEPYVGALESASRYETFAVVPTVDDWSAGERTGLCLLARKDGQWMTAPARASGE